MVYLWFGENILTSVLGVLLIVEEFQVRTLQRRSQLLDGVSQAV